MSAPVHLAAVEEVECLDFGDAEFWGFRAVCIDTGTECDAYGFTVQEAGTCETEEEAILAAVSYLSKADLHFEGSPNFCHARHVLVDSPEGRALAGTPTQEGPR